MTRSVLNALKAVAVLVCISVVCVGALAVCNMFFPKYEPTLDAETAALINALCPTGVSDDAAFADGYIVMLGDDDYGVKLAAYNKDNKSARAEILAVYGMPKGDNAGAYVIECVSQGYSGGDVTMLVAYTGAGAEAKIIGAAVKKKLNQSYWDKLPIDDILGGLEGTTGPVDLKSEFGKTGATFSLTAIDRAVNMAAGFAAAHGEDVVKALGEKGKSGAKEARLA